MARDCCWNCAFYIARGDNEPTVLSGADANICIFTETQGEEGETSRSFKEIVGQGTATSPGYVCLHYKERFY